MRNYRITVEEMDTENTLQFEMQDREDILAIVGGLRKESGLDEESATRLGLALRFLGPIMVQNKKHSLFSEFMPHFVEFMKHLKTSIKKK